MRVSSFSVYQNAYRHNKNHNNEVSTALERLSSGMRINRASDDASGLSMSKKMRAQLELLKTEQDALAHESSKSELADGSLGAVHEILISMTALATRAMNGGMDADYYAMNAEYQQLASEIDRLSGDNHVNKSGEKLLDFGVPAASSPAMDSTAITITGKNYNALLDALDTHLREKAAGETKNMTPDDLRRAAADFVTNQGQAFLDEENGAGLSDISLTVSGGNIYMSMSSSISDLGLSETDLLSADNAAAALEATKSAIKNVALKRADIGAAQRRMEASQNLIDRLRLELEGSLSVIEDADMATEMMNFVREQMLAQTSAFAMVHNKISAEKFVSMLFDK